MSPFVLGFGYGFRPQAWRSSATRWLAEWRLRSRKSPQPSAWLLGQLSDTLFYRGVHLELHKMISELVAISDLKVEVVLHTGPGIAKSSWSKKPIAPADWSITIGKGGVTPIQDEVRVDIWIGGGLSLSDLEIPSSLQVTSGGEIDAFIHKHESPKSKN